MPTCDSLATCWPCSTTWPQKQTRVQRLEKAGVRELWRPARCHASYIAAASTRPT